MLRTRGTCTDKCQSRVSRVRQLASETHDWAERESTRQGGEA
jgi:hypothetical protein